MKVRKEIDRQKGVQECLGHATAGRTKYVMLTEQVRGIADRILLAIVAALPFCSLVEHFVFGGAELAGISVANLVISSAVIISTALYLSSYSKRKRPLLCLMLLLPAVTLAKLAFQPVNNLFGWLAGHQYYFLVPLFAFCCASFDRSRYRVLISLLLNSSIAVCFVALFFFVTDNYYGLVSQDVVTAYDVVGMPFTRMMATFGSPNVAGSYFAILLYLDLNYGCASNKTIKLRRFLLGLCLFLTFSRMAIIGFLIAELIEFLYSRMSRPVDSRSRIAHILIALGFIVAIAALFVVLSNMGLYFFDFLGPDILQNPRLAKWLAFISNGASSLLLGEPIGSAYVYDGYSLSDNSILCGIASYGLFVAAAYWLLLFLGFRKACGHTFRVPMLVMASVFLVLSDFIQLFPSNYCMLLLMSLDCKSD